MNAIEFVRSRLLTGKCVSVWSIMKEARQLGFTREEIHSAREQDPTIEVRGPREAGCWRLSP